jgi:hypothetical protein
MICRVHKRLRQACPAFLLVAFVSNACLSNDPFYLHLLLLHELFYLAALVGLFFALGNRWRRVLSGPTRLAAKAVGLLHRTWQSIPGCRRRISAPSQDRPAANHAAH